MDERTYGILVLSVIVVVFGALGVIFAVLRNHSKKKFDQKKRICRNGTNATVVRIVKKRIRRSDMDSFSWYPTYEYYVNGIRYEKESTFGNKKKLFQEGQLVEIYYNPANPEEFYVPAEKAEGSVMIFTIFAVTYIAIAIIILIVMLVLFV